MACALSNWSPSNFRFLSDWRRLKLQFRREETYGGRDLETMVVVTEMRRQGLVEKRSRLHEGASSSDNPRFFDSVHELGRVKHVDQGALWSAIALPYQRLQRWDQARLGSDYEDHSLDLIIHPSKAEATIWLVEEIHRLTSSHLQIAELWGADPMYHMLIDPIIPNLPQT